MIQYGSGEKVPMTRKNMQNSLFGDLTQLRSEGGVNYLGQFNIKITSHSLSNRAAHVPSIPVNGLGTMMPELIARVGNCPLEIEATHNRKGILVDSISCPAD